jgi:hypothetical protein
MFVIQATGNSASSVEIDCLYTPSGATYACPAKMNVSIVWPATMTHGTLTSTITQVGDGANVDTGSFQWTLLGSDAQPLGHVNCTETVAEINPNQWAGLGPHAGPHIGPGGVTTGSGLIHDDFGANQLLSGVFQADQTLTCGGFVGQNVITFTLDLGVNSASSIGDAQPIGLQ